LRDWIPDDAVICPEAASQYEQSLFNAVSQYLLSADHMCTTVLEVCEAPHEAQIDLVKAVNKVLASKPASLADDDFVNKIYAGIEADKTILKRQTITAVQISDVHLDHEYVEGTKAKCDSFLCCRSESGMPTSKDELVAGKWGNTDGMCDTPVHTFQSLLDFVVSDEIAPDMIFWTGDNSSHNIWNNTVEEVTGYTEDVTNMIKASIQDTDITMLPIHGNHDTWPVDE